MNPDIFIPLVVVVGPVLVLVAFLRFRHLQAQARYATLLQLADKGVELAPQLLLEPRPAFSERRRALVLISLGIGTMAMLFVLPGHFDNGLSVGSLWGIGLLPMITGCGYLASWWLDRRGTMHG